ncbi:CRISPR-associated endonuclease Cas2 [Desulfurispirillum indicum]|uniref:CRISPR-associated endonuclease Cas2 n=1 Tax=Desulfurispirillum indicum TaxID=936456 RepID=UPI001CF9BDFD|nr:CRISPR-associated endonuclease Cas2 [Desulfurispirillum indicum]UCZ57713.1 CRISPR-associated endonuclease Cas2 [Desulfurispirillum indicum]
MLAIVAYDSPDTRRRNRIHKLLKGYGSAVQRSVFECTLNRRTITKLNHELQRVIDPQHDNVRIYTLCHTCRQQSSSLGIGELEQEHLILFA